MSGGRKKRKDIERGRAASEEFANRASAQLQPFAQAGQPALTQLSGLSGIGTPEQITASNDAFNNSLFYKGGENAFNLEKDAIDAGLANQGVAFSGARLQAVEDARVRNFQHALNGFLGNTTNIAGIGANAATGQANVLTNQANNELNAGFAKAGTRRGVLGTLGDIATIGRSAFGGGGFL